MPAWRKPETNKEQDSKTSQGALVPVDQLHPQLPEKRKQPAPAPQRRGCAGYCALFGGLSLLTMVLVFAFLTVVMVIGVVGFLSDPLDNFLGVFGFEKNSTPQEVDSQVIILGIREMALLQTASGDTQITKEVIDSGAAPDARLRMSYIGSVNVGIDLELLADDDITVNPDGSLTVQLPPIQILDCALRQPTVVSSSCTDIPLVQDCDKIRTALQDAAYVRALDELRTLAQDNEIQTLNGQGVLDVAYEKAEDAIHNLIVRLNGDVRVQFVRSAEQLPPGATCFP